jgi:Domain of unknown function (DUF4347)
VKKAFAGIRATIQNAVERRLRDQPEARTSVFEALEPRLLFSADLAPAVLSEQVTPSAFVQQQPAQATSAPAIEVFVVDTRVTNFQVFLADIEKQQATGRALTVIQVAETDDGLALISDAVSQAISRGFDVSAIHIISHGRDGEFDLGNRSINQITLRQEAAQFAAWSGGLSQNADVLIYGCNLAASSVGQSFAANLAALTGADVAGNSDATGANSLGGDWTLDYRTGLIETGLAVSTQTQEGWNNLLGVAFSSDPVNVSGSAAGAAITGTKLNTADSSAGRTVATDSAGNYAVAWVSQVGLGSVKLAFFNENGTPKEDFFNGVLPVMTVSSELNSAIAQSQPSIAMSASGALVVVWNQNSTIVGQRYNSFGKAIGGNFIISSTAEPCTQPSVAINDLNQFVVTWTRDSGNFPGSPFFHDIWGESFNWNLTNLMPEQRLNSPIGGEQTRSSVAISGNRFAVAFEGLDGFASVGVKLRVFNVDGTNATTEIIANTDQSYEEGAPDVAMSFDRIVVTWQVTDSGVDAGTRYRVFDQNLNEIRSEQTVDSQTAFDQLLPKVSMSASGDFVIVNQSVAQAPDNAGWGVFGRLFNRDGNPQAPEVSLSYVDATKPDFVANDQFAVAIAWRGEQAVAVWTSDTDSSGFTVPQVFARRATVIGPTVPSSLVVNAPNGAAAYIKEGQAAAVFAVHLSSQPSSSVTINASISSAADGTIIGGQVLVFTPTNWMIDQLVTVTAVPDYVVDADSNFSVILSPAPGNAPGFDTLAIQRIFTLINQNVDELHEITVNTAGDVVDGDCTSLTALYLFNGADNKISLREALLAAGNTTNLGTGAIPIDKINFAIPGVPYLDVVIASPNLPVIHDAVFIDGSTQQQFNSNRIVLDGQSSFAGLNLAQSASAGTVISGSSGSTISTLTLRGFANSGIEVYTTKNLFTELVLENNAGSGIDFRDDGAQVVFRNKLENSFVNGNSGAGVRVSGAWGVTLLLNRITNNGGQGILLTSLNGTGPTSAYSTQVIENTIGGNGASGIEIIGTGAQKNQLYRNYIGVDRNGLAMSNSTDGVLIINGASDNEVGGLNPSDGNIIANNGGVGVRILSGAPGTSDSINNRIFGNRIFNNASIGIDYTQFDSANGLYPTASPDAGNPNNPMNAPSLFSASSDGLSTNVIGELKASSNADYRLQFFSNPAGSLASAYSGTTFLGFQDVRTDANGYATINYFANAGSAATGTITATATKITDLNFLSFSGTSEFSASERIKPAFSTPENQQISIFTHNDVTDQTATGLVYALDLSQSDSANFSINGTTGELTFLNLPDYEAMPLEPNSGADHTWWAHVLVGNGVYSETLLYVVDVTDANDSPTVSVVPTLTTNLNTSVAINSIVIADQDALTIAGNVDVVATVIATDGLGQRTGSFNISTILPGASIGQGSITLAGKLSAVQTALQTLRFTPSLNNTQTAYITVALEDLGSGFGLGETKKDVKPITVTVVTANSAPVLTIPMSQVIVPFGMSATLGNPVVPTLWLSDANAGTSELVLTVSTYTSYGSLSLPPSAASAITSGIIDGDSTFVLHGTTTRLQQLMNQLSFSAGYGFSGPTGVTFSVNDQQGGTTSGSLPVFVTANAPPVVSNDAPVVIFNENQPVTPLFANALISDTNQTNLTKARVTAVSGFLTPSDVFNYSPFPAVIETAGAPNERIFTGSATVLQYQNWLRGISYFNASDSPLSTGGVLRVEFYDGFAWSAPVEVTVQVVAQNDAPQLDFGPSLVRNVAFNGNLVLGSSAPPVLRVSDVDAGLNVLNLDVTAASGLLSLPPWVASYIFAGDATGASTFVLRGTCAQLQLVINELVYTAPVGFSGETQVQFVLNDLGNTGVGGFLSDTEVLTMHVAADGVPLVNGVNASITFVENGAPINAFPSLSISDIDNSVLVEARVTMSSGFLPADTLAFAATLPSGVNMIPADANGMIQILGSATLAEYATLLKNFTYVNTSNAPSAVPRVISVQVYDGSNWSLLVSTTISVQAVDDLPVLELPEFINVAFGGTTDLRTQGGPLSLTDVDASREIYELVISANSGLIGLHSLDGVSVVSGNPTGATKLVLQGTIDSLNTILTTDLYYIAPAGTVRSDSVDLALYATEVSQVSIGLPASVGSPLTSASSAVIVLAGTPPVVSESTLSVSFVENSEAVNFATSLLISGGNSGTLTEALINISTAYDPQFDVLSVTTSNNLTATWNATNGELRISGIATNTIYEKVLQSLKFSNSSENPNTADRTIEMFVFDGLQWSDVARTTVTVTAINDVPTLTVSPSINSVEDAPLAFANSGLIVSDVDSNGLVLVIQVSNGTLTWQGSSFAPTGLQILAPNKVQLAGTKAEINAWATNVTFNPDANFNGQATVQWSLTDTGVDAQTANAISTIVISPVNDIPQWQGVTVVPPVIVTPPSSPGSGTSGTSGTGGGSTVKDIVSGGGPTAPPTGSASDNIVVSDSATLPGTVSTAPGASANSSNSSRSVSKNTNSLSDNVLTSTNPIALSDAVSKSLNVSREIGQSVQEAPLSGSSLSASLAATAAGVKFDGFGFTRVKNPSEMAEYVEIARATLRDKLFADEVQKVRDEMTQTLKLDRNVVASATAVSTSLSIGYVIWLVRGGALLSSLMASIPAWRLVDPLPVLGNMDTAEDQSDDDSLDAMIDKSKAKRLADAQMQYVQ